MGKAIEMVVGQRFNKWIILSEIPKSERNSIYRLFLCRCDCGKEKLMVGSALRDGYSTRCRVCGVRDGLPRNFRHGMKKTRIYRTWCKIVERCYNSHCKCFKNYGGRGIAMCKEWKNDFQAFFRDMGLPPSPKHSIERVDNNGNYEPGNCRWATSKEQAQNRRNNRILTLKGETHVVTEWAHKFGIKESVLFRRLERGWSVEEALTTPVRHNNGTVTNLLQL